MGLCLSCQNVEVSESEVCNKCYFASTGIDRDTGKVDFRFSKDFKNPYAGEILESELIVFSKKRKSKGKGVTNAITQDDIDTANEIAKCQSCNDLTIDPHKRKSKK